MGLTKKFKFKPIKLQRMKLGKKIPILKILKAKKKSPTTKIMR